MNKSINANALESVTIKNVTISGTKDAGNGKINFKTPVLNVKGVEIEEGSTVYNVFEGPGTTTEEFYTKKVTLDGVKCDNTSLQHNIINVYSPASGATITVKNSSFNLEVRKSNVLRISNYTNADNVNVVFENVDWTYENSQPISESDESLFEWAGLVLVQAAGDDVAVSGDTSHLSTWKFTFKNCRYNGVKVTANTFKAHNQVLYTYSIGTKGATTDGSEFLNIKFA